ncbi:MULTISPECIES: phage terminase small subunit [Moraxella]|uniref:Phage terminase, endonuclease subunit n=1 Tax=Moraxella catarrhalis TaxID=480 RepID=A0A7Z1A3H2_MORCA|nr:phage terminase small subunit [Moraxella catarrhalis]OAV00211.1 Phage terminase, endonuclease subunit [Moraxella catarrhalis]STY82479.1 Phage small terminase subunit [Moraxella catarrhalis]
MNLARAHFLKHAATQAATKAAEYGEMQHATVYELMLRQLANDKHRLKQVQSTELKIALKSQIIADYLSYAQGVVASDSGVQDEVLMYTLVWLIDLRQYSDALPIAYYAIKHNLIMPDAFKRTITTLIVEEIADNELKLIKSGQPVDIQTLESLHEFISGTDAVIDMPDPVRAKLYLAIGKHYLARAKDGDAVSASSAVDALSLALSYDDRCGGKADLAAAKKLAA